MRKLITGLLLVVIVLFFARISSSLDEEPVIGWDGKPVPKRVTKSKPEEIPSLPGAMEKSEKVYVLYEIDIYSKSKFGGKLITKADSGTVLTVLKKEGDWINIRTLNEKFGWVHKDWVVGNKDKIIPLSQGKYLHNNIKNSKIVVLDAGHDLLISKAIDIFREMKRFICK